MKAADVTTLVLAGGQGTRLQPILPDRAKPMAPVAGRPFLEWLLPALAEQGLRRFVICTGHLAADLEEALGDGRRWNIQIEYSREGKPLGTGGALRNASARIRSDPFLAVNGDSYCRLELDRLFAFHADKAAAASLWLLPASDRDRYGSVEIDGDGKVTAFGEKRPGTGSGLVNGGTYLLGRSILEEIADDRAVSLESETFPSLVGRGLYGISGEGPLIDIGTPESYAAAQKFFADETCL
ncbi:MAG TPA: nucleotidyltransferase family protein [Thermoanaerobaculia bacterium]|nr:nucleotidyltransferase family protein [Thermoanaerobaculia bacterium]